MFKKFIWPTLAFISIFLALVFTIGFIFTINIDKNNPEDFIEPADKEEDLQNSIKESDNEEINVFNILVLGDSIGFGVGDETNKGIGERYKDLINEEENQNIEVENISIPGYESKDLLNLLESNKNDGIISLADIIIISIGGNDLNRIEYEDALSLNINYNDKLKFYKENLQKIIEKIRKINKEAHLAIIGLYDPYAQDEPQKTRFLLEWNYETGLIVNLNYKIAYVPTYEVFKYHLDSYLSADEFHPSGEGYQAIVEEIYDILDY
jgi:lysophospholipase L1-like esterase